VGDDRQAILDHLTRSYDEVVSGGAPRTISLESSLGLDKTGLVQELFAHLAQSRQGPTAYWLHTLDWSGPGRTMSSRRASRWSQRRAGWSARATWS